MALAQRSPVVVAIGASIHATEIGATQAVNELLHALASANDAETLNPDGHILTVD